MSKINNITVRDMYRDLETLKTKVEKITTITDEEKEIYLIVTKLLENSIDFIDDICETMEC